MIATDSHGLTSRLEDRLREYRKDGEGRRPLCTLAYAQSLDGCIALHPMSPLALSGRESMALTHRLRAAHDAILVGIRTVLADNPRLTVRLAPGASPQPVILDSRLRMPLEARLLENGERRPWIMTTGEADPERCKRMEERGGEVFRLPATSRGRVALEPLLELLRLRGIRSLMVEGGGRVMSSFLQSRLVDQVVVTIAPVMVGGVRAYRRGRESPAVFPGLREVRYASFGLDLVLWGHPVWEDS